MSEPYIRRVLLFIDLATNSDALGERIYDLEVTIERLEVITDSLVEMKVRTRRLVLPFQRYDVCTG